MHAREGRCRNNCVFTDECLMVAQDTVTNKATANHNVSGHTKATHARDIIKYDVGRASVQG